MEQKHPNQSADTPRTKHRKDLCQRRLAYFNGSEGSVREQSASVKPSPPVNIAKPTKAEESQTAKPVLKKGTKGCRKLDATLLTSMQQDPRIHKLASSDTKLESDDGGPISLNAHEGYFHGNLLNDSKNDSSYQNGRGDIVLRDVCLAADELHVQSKQQRPTGHLTTVKTFECEVKSEQPQTSWEKDTKQMKTESRTQEFHFSMNQNALQNPPAENMTKIAAACKDNKDVYNQNTIDTCKTDPQPKEKLLQITVENKSDLPRRGSSRERSSSPSKRSVVSDWTISNFTMDDDFTDVSELGFSTHRPSEPSHRSHIGDLHTVRPNVADQEDSVILEPVRNDVHGSTTVRSSSDLYNSVDTENLKDVLGTEKYERLLKNFEDCDDETDISIGDVLNAQGNRNVSSTIYQNDTEEEDIMKTHRPQTDYNYNTQYDYSYYPHQSQSADKLSSGPSQVKCAFHVDDIYKVAKSCNEPNSSKNSWKGKQHSEVTMQTGVVQKHSVDGKVIENGSTVSNTSSSLVGREFRSLRCQPSGPIPQKHKDRSTHSPDAYGNLHGISRDQVQEGMTSEADHFKRQENGNSKDMHNQQRADNSSPVERQVMSENIQRYLLSLKTSQPDPVPQPDQLDTPGRGLHLHGHQVKTFTDQQTKQDNVRVDKLFEPPRGHFEENQSDSSPVKCDNHWETSSSLATTNLLRPSSDCHTKVDDKLTESKTTNLSKSKCDHTDSVDDKLSVHHSQPAEKQQQNSRTPELDRQVVDCKEGSAGLVSDDPENHGCTARVNDDLYSRVTSVVSGDGASGLTERMEKLGINFDFLKKSVSGEPNYIVDEIIPVKTSCERVVSDSTNVLPQPGMSMGLPKESISDVKKQKKVPDCVKVCPECAGINRPYMDWCTECGEVLIGVDPVPSKLKKTEHRKVKNWLKEEATMARAAENNKLHVPVNDSLKVSQDSNVRDSDTFQYEDNRNPTESLSNNLRTELSLNLRSSSSTTDSMMQLNPQPSHKSSKPSKKSEKIEPVRAEEIAFVYEEPDVSTISLPAALRAELSINLGDSMDSQNSRNNVSKKKMKSLEQKLSTPNKKKSEKQEKNNQSGAAAQAVNSHEIAPNQIPNHPEDAQNNGIILEDSDENGDIYDEFVSCLKNDPRFKPSQSKDGPKNSTVRGLRRPQSAGATRSSSSVPAKGNQSLDPEMYRQRWATSSTTWKSQDPVRSSGLYPGRVRDRPSSAHVSRISASVQASRGHHQLHDVAQSQSNVQRPHSAGKLRSSVSNHMLSVGEPRPHNSRSADNILTVKPVSQGASISRGAAQSKALSAMEEMGKYMAMAHGYTSKLYEKDDIVHHIKRPQYHNYLAPEDIDQMSPRIQEGELSMMLCLPEEILLYIFTYLSHEDLMRCASVCLHFKRIALDPHLWKKIVLKKRVLTDSWLIEIGSKNPSSLSLIQCTGDKITVNGIRELFRNCGDNLQELNITGCNRGHLSGDRLILHAISRCHHLTHVDVSWSNVDDCGVMALADSCHNLESLCLNGCPTISDEAIHSVVIKHGLYLKTLELFGCFNLTQKACTSITLHCKGLNTLNMGQCWKIPDTSLSSLTASLGLVQNLDLRGCKQMKDATVHQIVRNCPRLETLALANCPNITDSALLEIATMTDKLKSLDVCGCKKLTNVGIKAIATSCQKLEYLDISSTGITSKGVCSIASYCNRNLQVLKVNFCKQITASCLVKLARHCKSMKKLYLYGLTGIRDTSEILRENPKLWIEM